MFLRSFPPLRLLLLIFFITLCSSFSEGPQLDDLIQDTQIGQESEQQEESPESSGAKSHPGEKSSSASRRFYNNNLSGKTALIIRAGKIAIPPSAQLVANNMKKAFSGIPSTQKTIEHFTKKYLVDGNATESKLRSMGYTIKRLYSSDYPSGSKYKQAVRDAMENPDTSLVLFYGHGDTGNGVALYYPSEYAFQDPSHLKSLLNPSSGSKAYLSATEVQSWLKGRKLDGLILMSCNGAYQTYLAKHKVVGKSASGRYRWDQLVSDNGFFAGWATYSLYFDPRTPRILNSLDRHQKSKPGYKKVYYIRTGPFLRKISLLGGLDDGDAYWNQLAKDSKVKVHDEKVDEMVASLVDLVSEIKEGRRDLYSSVRSFLIRHEEFLKKEGIENTNSDGSFGELGTNPTHSEVNRYINANANSILTQALSAVVPDLVLPLKTKLSFIPGKPNHVKIDTRFRIIRGKGIEKVFSFLSQQAQFVKGLDRETLEKNLKKLHRNFPEIDFDVQATLERRIEGGKPKVIPVVHGYRLVLGKMKNRLPSKSSPYEIHASTTSLNQFVEDAIEGQFGEYQKVFSKSWTIDYLINSTTISIAGYIKLYDFKGLNIYHREDGTLDISAKWKFKINWPWLGNRYAYATTKIFLKRTMLQEPNSVRVKPKIQLVLGSGWAPQVPDVSWLPTGLVNKGFEKASKWVIGTGIEKTFHFFAEQLNELIHQQIGDYLPDDPDGKAKFDRVIKENPFIKKFVSKEKFAQMRANANKQKLVIESVQSSGSTITAKLSSLVLNLTELIPGSQAKSVTSEVLIKDLVIKKDRISAYIDLR